MHAHQRARRLERHAGAARGLRDRQVVVLDQAHQPRGQRPGVDPSGGAAARCHGCHRRSVQARLGAGPSVSVRSPRGARGQQRHHELVERDALLGRERRELVVQFARHSHHQPTGMPRVRVVRSHASLISKIVSTCQPFFLVVDVVMRARQGRARAQRGPSRSLVVARVGGGDPPGLGRASGAGRPRGVQPARLRGGPGTRWLPWVRAEAASV